MGKPDRPYSLKKTVGRGFTHAVVDEPLSLDDLQLIPVYELEESNSELLFIVWGDPLDPDNAVWVRWEDNAEQWVATTCNPTPSESWSLFPFVDGDKVTRNYSVIPHGLCAACDGPCSVGDYLCGGCRA